jgi:hypothetical protein
MDIQAAIRAGAIAHAIEQRNEKRALVETAISEHWKVVNVLAQNPATGESVPLILGDLDDASSQAGLGFIAQMYDAQLAALAADLATAETWTPPVPEPTPEPPPPEPTPEPPPPEPAP